MLFLSHDVVKVIKFELKFLAFVCILCLTLFSCSHGLVLSTPCSFSCGHALNVVKIIQVLALSLVVCFHYCVFCHSCSPCCEHAQHSNSTMILVIILSFVSNLHANHPLFSIFRIVSIFVLKVIICCHVATRIDFTNLISSSWFVVAKTSNPMQ